MALGAILLIVFLNILCNSDSASGLLAEFYDCDLLDSCDGISRADCETLKGKCINGYHKWEKYSKNNMVLAVKSKKDFEILFEPVNVPLIKDLTIFIGVNQCNSSDCNNYRILLDTRAIYDFERGNLL